MPTVLGIIDTYDAGAVDKLQQQMLREIFKAMRAYTKAQGEPAIQWAAKPLYNTHSLAELSRSIKKADAVVMVTYAAAHNRLDRFIEKTETYLRFEHASTLRGKWIGVVLVGAKNAIMLEPYTDRLLSACAKAGMLVLPPGIVAPLTRRSREHLQFARDLAQKLSTQPLGPGGASEWREHA